jgi:hypothetical protein
MDTEATVHNAVDGPTPPSTSDVLSYRYQYCRYFPPFFSSAFPVGMLLTHARTVTNAVVADLGGLDRTMANCPSPFDLKLSIGVGGSAT